MRMAERFPRGEEEVEALSDWECVKHAENLREVTVDLTKSLRATTRAAKATAGNLSATLDWLPTVAAAEGAQDLEMFLAIDHPA